MISDGTSWGLVGAIAPHHFTYTKKKKKKGKVKNAYF